MPRHNETKDTPKADRKAARNVSVPKIPRARVNAADRMSITIPLAVAIAAPAGVRLCTKSSAAKGATAVVLVSIAHMSRTTIASGTCVSETRILLSMPSHAPDSAVLIRRRNTAGIVM